MNETQMLPGGYWTVPPNRPPTPTTAITSMVLGIGGIVTCCCALGVPSVLAIIFGHMALRSSLPNGRGFAIAGLTMGYITVVPSIGWTVLNVINFVSIAKTGQPAIGATS